MRCAAQCRCKASSGTCLVMSGHVSRNLPRSKCCDHPKSSAAAVVWWAFEWCKAQALAVHKWHPCGSALSSLCCSTLQHGPQCGSLVTPYVGHASMILVVAGCFLTFTRTVRLQWHAVVCKVFPATSLLMDMSLACLCAVDALQRSSVHTCLWLHYVWANSNRMRA